MHTMLNVQNMQNSLLLTERTSALWAVYGYFYNYNYRQYQYTSAAQPGDASPYSVSSELYKHVLPQYFQFSRPTSRGSVLV